MVANRPKVAVVLGQGGLKPSSAIPIFELLDENNIPIDMIVGCSGGSLIGGLHAYGYDREKIKDVINEVGQKQYLDQLNHKQLLAMMQCPFIEYDKTQGVVIPSLMIEDLSKTFGNIEFKDLPKRLVVVGTDFNTGENICIEEGIVQTALYASSCIYPFMPPAKIGNRLVVDGALSCPIPFYPALEYKPDMVIVITFTFFPDYWPEGFLNCCDNFFSQAIERKGLELFKDQLENFEGKVIHVDICLDEQISVTETHRIDQIIEAGEEAAKASKEKILEMYEEITTSYTK